MLTVAALTVSAAACEPPPSFYEPPASLPSRPGDVIASVETNFGINTNVRSTAIKYRSTSATGQPNYVTGTLLVPKAAWTGGGPRPVVAYAVGTQGLGDDCAASKSMTSSLLYEQGNIQGLLDRGWAVAVTDYEKLGTPGDHTYVVKDAEAHAILDLVRAAQRLPGSGIAADAPVGVVGYSQGGQAAAAVAELEATYAPELNIKGVAAGGVPSDLARLADHLNGPGSFFFSFLALAAAGLNSAYPELNLEAYLNQAGRDMLAAGREACLIDGLALGAFKNISSVTHTNPLATPQWQARVNEQRLGNVRPQVPVYLYHGVLDEIIPYDQGTSLRTAWCGRGARIQWADYWLAEHLLGIFAAQGDVTNWLHARFTNQPFTPTCN
ncbi:MAG TPA: lipase family protein [Acidimicrobiales bacterium]